MTHTNKLRFSILFSALLVSPISFASLCNEQSPNFTSMGDSYYDLNSATPLTSKNKKLLRPILKKLSGRWKGKGTTYECVGAEFEAKPQIKKLIVTARMSTNSSGELHIDAEKQVIIDKIRYPEQLFFFGDINHYHDTSITSNEIKFTERFWAVNSAKYRLFFEIQHTIELSQTSFNYTLRKYLNGSFTIEEKWQLTRKK